MTRCARCDHRTRLNVCVRCRVALFRSGRLAPARGPAGTSGRDPERPPLWVVPATGPGPVRHRHEWRTQADDAEARADDYMSRDPA